MIPYEWITDGTRWITKPDSFTGIDQTLNDAAASYRRSLWHDQAVDVHIFTEKDAISGVILPVTEAWDVPLGVLRGYSSESFAHAVSTALYNVIWRGKEHVYVYQLVSDSGSKVATAVPVRLPWLIVAFLHQAAARTTASLP